MTDVKRELSHLGARLRSVPEYRTDTVFATGNLIIFVRTQL